VALAVVEATGGVERRLVGSLRAAGLAVAVAAVNPRPIRDFARAVGPLARTDRPGAEVPATFAERMRPRPALARSAAQQRLADLALRRRQLGQPIQAEHHRRRRGAERELRRSLDQHLAWPEREVARIERLIERAAVAALPDGGTRAGLPGAAPGVGRVTAAAPLALPPELGQLDGKAIASLTGTAPFARGSGMARGKRTVGPGRPAAGPRRPPHGGAGRHALRPGDPRLLPASRPGRQTQEACAHRRQARTRGRPQRHPAHRHPVAGGGVTMIGPLSFLVLRPGLVQVGGQEGRRWRRRQAS
jgi:hypothetical protein